MSQYVYQGCQCVTDMKAKVKETKLFVDKASELLKISSNRKKSYDERNKAVDSALRNYEDAKAFIDSKEIREIRETFLSSSRSIRETYRSIDKWDEFSACGHDFNQEYAKLFPLVYYNCRDITKTIMESVKDMETSSSHVQ
jgi:hypothetical protein